VSVVIGEIVLGL